MRKPPLTYSCSGLIDSIREVVDETYMYGPAFSKHYPNNSSV